MKLKPDSETTIPSTLPIKRKRKQLTDVALLFLFYVMILIFFTTITDSFFSFSNTLNILDSIAVLGIVAIGQAFTIISGGFDFSVGGVVPLGAVVYVTIINAGVNVPLAIIIVLAVGGMVGLINGLLIGKLRITPLIATLGTFSVTAGLASVFTGGLTTALDNPDAAFLAGSSVGGISYYVWLLILLSVLGFITLHYTVFGRTLYALGGNKEATRLAGISTDLITILVYIISGSLAALAGIVVASQLMAGSGTMGLDTNLLSITAVILGGGSLAGGTGGIIGTLVGVLILGTLSNGMALIQVQSFYQQIGTGVVLLIAVISSRLRNDNSEE
ncbi:ABC transporter permease [Salipaludibacillus sp. CF4.18]|uniref:ABC transporter permease n=1 Tax=Salipaludibacillus sp. CF4.18 TaxID=3373081 RepID=UPI003EE524B0